MLDLLSAQAFRSLPRPDSGYDQVSDLTGWLTVLRRDVTRLRAFYRDHPGLARAVTHDGGKSDVPHDHTTGDRRAPEFDALVRLGVPEDRARRCVLAVAHWTMAALATEPPTIQDAKEPTRHAEEAAPADSLFDDGFDLLLDGLAAHLLGPPR